MTKPDPSPQTPQTDWGSIVATQTVADAITTYLAIRADLTSKQLECSQLGRQLASVQAVAVGKLRADRGTGSIEVAGYTVRVHADQKGLDVKRLLPGRT